MFCSNCGNVVGENTRFCLWPHVNTEDSGTVGLTGLVLLCVGVVVLVFGIKGKSRKERKNGRQSQREELII